MRIISDFHDYYDAVQRMGQDQDLIYQRTRKVEELGSWPFPCFPRLNWQTHRKISMQTWIVGFCGKVYPVIKLSKISAWAVDDQSFCHCLADIDRFISSSFRKRENEEYRSRANRTRHWPVAHQQQKFRAFFDAYEKKRDAFTKLFQPGCPVFAATRDLDISTRFGHIVHNACLKELDFFRVFNTHSAFQEIAMYLGAQAQPDKPIPEVSDKDMIGAKGFDEFSFRKPPGKKRK